ncbi:MAG: lytic transglycosylase domain-containing protein [Selenomonadaceae bacterium]|jgi:soluble lytic murein transglycosylase-like protein|nr:lytic transglycosylase domain-containing protein [Selenomonadaceae bacterium]
MDISSLSAVVNRIEAIETKIGLRRSKGGPASFQQMLDKQIQAQKPNAGGTTASAQAAQKPQPQKTPVSPTSAADAAAAAAAAPVPADSAYLDVIREAAGKYGVDPKLVSAVAEIESGFSQDAISATGAVGVMQLMPETAESLGVNPYDAKQNINGGTQYLRQMLDSFNGDVRKAVAAYNAGPEAVREYGGVPPYSETQQYVSSVLDIYR